MIKNCHFCGRRLRKSERPPEHIAVETASCAKCSRHVCNMSTERFQALMKNLRDPKILARYRKGNR